ncbi:MAG: class I SAM-dependent methyltransferase [Patescibacteria group bacterium]
MDKKDTSWGKVAGWYDEMLENKDGTYQKEVILPNLMRLVNPQKGEVIMDIACGQGFFSRALDEAGAKVTGVDIAKELISLAKMHSSKSITFEVAPADMLNFVKDGSFDKALIVLALQNIENLQGTVREAYRVLKPGGTFYIVLNHPAYRIPKGSSWNWDQATHRQYRRIDAYMSDARERIEMNPGAQRPGEKRFTISFHRPMQVYFKNLTKAGFLVSRLEEWVSHKESNPGPRQTEENRIRKEIPMFLFIEAKKL